MSRINPEKGVLTKALIEERLPKRATSVSVIGRFSVVFADEKRTRVDDGQVYMIPIVMHRKLTAIFVEINFKSMYAIQT